MFPRRSLRNLLAIATLLFLAASTAWCQVTNMADTTSTPVPGAGHNYFGVLNETVNPANGSVSVRIAFPMPPGRKLTAPFSLAYDSNGTVVLNPTAGGITWGGAVGWSYSAPTLTVATQDVNLQDGSGGVCRVALNYMYADASGARHPLYLSIYGFLPGKAGNCANAVMPDGLAITQATTGSDALVESSTTAIPNNQSFSLQKVLVADADGTVATFNPAGEGLGSTGGKFVANSIEDRNGNVITVNQEASSPFRFTGYTDTLNRSAVSVSYGESGSGTGTDTISVSGLSQPYYASWYGSATVNSTTLSVNQYSGSCMLNGVDQAFTTLSGFTLPNGQSYTFSYDPNYGTLQKITYPTGGYVRYVWGVNTQSQAGFANGTLPGGSYFGCSYHYDTPVVTDRYVSFDGTNEVLHQHFTYTTTWETGANAGLFSNKTTAVTTYDLLRSGNFTTTYAYSGTLVPNQPNTDVAITNQIPLEYSIAYNDWSGSLLRTVYKNWANQYEMSCESTTQSGLTSRVDYTYQQGAQVTDKKDWDWGAAPDCRSSSSGTPLRESKTTYNNITTAIFPGQPSVYDRPSHVYVYYGGNLNAQTDYTYDNGVSSVSATQHDDTNYPASNTVRGNVASKTAKCLQSCSDAVTKYTYDQTGQTTGMTDPNSNVTSYCYGDASPGCSSSTTNAYLTQITYPNTGVAHIEKFGYSLASGEVTSAIDQNQQPTNYQYTDPLARLTETDYPDGGKTTISYNDAAPSPNVTTSKLLSSGTSATTEVIMDGLGHATETQMKSDPAGVDYTDTTYDGLGRVWKVSNPYRSVTDSSYGVTVYTYDVLDRPSDESAAKSIQRPDGSTVSTTYPAANCVKVADEQGKARKTCTDAIGRLTSAVEDPSGVNYTTSYTYTFPSSNSYGLVFTSTQGSQTRTFTYDSLSRLTSSKTPELNVGGTQCSTTYSYDANGNLISRKAPRENQNTLCATLVTTTYGYDAMNRLTSKSYNDTSPQTPPANFFYDQAPSSWPNWPGVGFSYPTGRLVLACTGSAANTCASPATAVAYNYDSMGRIKDFWQCNPASCGSSIWDLNYTLDLAGDATQWVHPAGFTVYTPVNAAQQVKSVSSSSTGANEPQVLAQGPGSNDISYTPWGAISQLENGCTGSGCANAQETYIYNNRLQPYAIDVGTTGNVSAEYCKVYNYYSSWTAPTSCPAPGTTPQTGTTNNGSVNAFWYLDGSRPASSHTETYTYDSLNRLWTAIAQQGSTTFWSQTYTYDRYGNMTCSGTGACTSMGYNSNNQLTSVGGSSLTYDAAGNLIQDNSTVPAHFYKWDAEGRLISIDNGSTASITFNALGQRVYATSSVFTGTYWRDPSGQFLGGQGSGGFNAEVPLEGRLLAEYASGNPGPVYFDHPDALGSGHQWTDWAGNSAGEVAFYPWGAKWGDTTNGSLFQLYASLLWYDPAVDGYQSNSRYLIPRFSRWLTPDPAGKGAVRLDDPQTWNMYAYVRNNPTTLTDPSGLAAASPIWGSDFNQMVFNGATYLFNTGDNVYSPPAAEKPQASKKNPCPRGECYVIMTLDEYYKPKRGSGNMAERQVEYQVRTIGGKEVHDVEVVLREEFVSGKEGDPKGICGGDGCSNKDPDLMDYRSGVFQDDIHVDLGTRKSFSVTQRFFVGGTQVPIHFGTSTRSSQIVDVRNDAIDIKPAESP